MSARSALVACLVLAACGATEPPEPLTAVTFNAGLAVGFVAGAESRLDPVAEAIATLDADVVCLQEIFLPDQVAAVRTASEGSFPHQFYPDPLPPESGPTPACDASEGELDGLLGCLESSCGEVCIDEVADCLLSSCVLPFLGLSKSCQGCAMAHVGEDPATARDTCEAEPKAYAYGHSFGTGLLSRHPLRDVEHQVYPSNVNRRGAIRATVDAPGGPVEVFCTHLTPDFTGLPYPDEGSWKEEQEAQFTALRAWTDEVAADAPVLLMGDFNAGPGLPGIDAEVPENYDLIADGFDNVFADQVGSCTLCGDNPLRDTSDFRLIDHILSRNVTAPVARRILDHDVPSETCGTTWEVPLSDHFGVELRFELAQD